MLPFLIILVASMASSFQYSNQAYGTETDKSADTSKTRSQESSDTQSGEGSATSNESGTETNQSADTSKTRSQKSSDTQSGEGTSTGQGKGKAGAEYICNKSFENCELPAGNTGKLVCKVDQKTGKTTCGCVGGPCNTGVASPSTDTSGNTPGDTSAGNTPYKLGPEMNVTANTLESTTPYKLGPEMNVTGNTLGPATPTIAKVAPGVKLVITRIEGGYYHVNVKGQGLYQPGTVREGTARVFVQMWGDDPLFDDRIYMPYEMSATIIDGTFGITQTVRGATLNEDWGQDEVYAIVNVPNIGKIRTNTVTGNY
jgi:hypothetical protein